ncbi:MAG: hypothetical protein MHM6MM_002050 [Cercozoa sp. M6MM]
MKLLAGLCAAAVAVSACTELRIVSKDNTPVLGRTLDFAVELESQVVTHPRGRVTQFAYNGEPAMKVNNEYGYVYVNGAYLDVVVDGINEKGLSFAALYFRNYASFKTEVENLEKAVPHYMIGHVVLGKCATAKEARKVLEEQIEIFGGRLPFTAATEAAGMANYVLPLHFSIQDASGDAFVMEIVENGTIKFHQNKVGVMTNSPTYDWHMANLANYANLRPHNAVPVEYNGHRMVPHSQGSGMHGLPGDTTSASRFVRTTAGVMLAGKAKTSKEAVLAAIHILKTVDIPYGLVRAEDNHVDYTQWAVVRVLKDNAESMLFMRDYSNPNFRAVDLSQLNFTEGAEVMRMPLHTGSFSYTDMSSHLAPPSVNSDGGDSEPANKDEL